MSNPAIVALRKTLHTMIDKNCGHDVRPDMHAFIDGYVDDVEEHEDPESIDMPITQRLLDIVAYAIASKE